MWSFLGNAKPQKYKHAPASALQVVFKSSEKGGISMSYNLQISQLEALEFLLFEYDRLKREQIDQNNIKELTTLEITLPTTNSQLGFFLKKDRTTWNIEDCLQLQSVMHLMADYLSFGQVGSLGLASILRFEDLPKISTYEFGLYIAKKMEWVPYGIYKFNRFRREDHFRQICFFYDKGICYFKHPRSFIVLQREHAVNISYYNIFWGLEVEVVPSKCSDCHLFGDAVDLTRLFEGKCLKVFESCRLLMDG